MRTFHALILVLILIFSGCRQAPQKFVIGVSQCSVDNWREKFNEELRTAALITDSLTVRIESANDDDRQQQQQIEKFISEGVDLLIVSPNQLKTISPALNRAYDQGIPVILYDRKSGSDKYTAFIGCDNHQIGFAMGHYIAQRLQGKGRVAEIRGLQGSSPALERHEGLVEALGEYPGIQLVASESGDWKQESGARAMQKILRQTPLVDYVFAHNDRMASGARTVAMQQGLADKMLFAGVDGLATDGGGLELVRDGLLDASYLYPTKGDEVVELAMRILTGEVFKRENYLQTSIVTAENAELSFMEAKDAERQRKNLGVLHRQVDSYVSQFHSQQVITVALAFILMLLMALVAVIWRALVAKAQMNRQLDESNEKLRQLNEQVIEQTHNRLVFFTNISHELRTPLTLIIDPVEQMQHDPSIRGRSRELLALIKRNAVALQQLVTTILDFRKIQNGKMTLQLEDISLADTLRQWVADFSPTAERKRISLHISTDGFTQDPVTTDREKLSHIVFNLMSNALKYTPQGGDVFITLADSPQDGRFSLSVRDTGHGLSADDCQKVFERFFQASGSKAGTGVGLAVVKSYTELLQGTATVESEQGRGANFIVELPVVEEEGVLLKEEKGAMSEERELSCSPTGEDVCDSDTSPIGAEASSVSPEHALSTPDQSATILIVDDNDDIRRYMHTILQASYQVLEAADGRQALDTARREVPDLVVCDVMMPGIDGLEVCRTLKQSVATSHIPVVMLTAKALDQQRAEGYQCGADSYITKPFSSAVLLARISNLLQQRALLRQRFSGEKPQPAEADSQTDAHEHTFMRQLSTIIDENLADSDFGVEQIGAEIGLSRVQLYRKVKALTGSSVVDLLRRARLKKARHLLETSHRSISEVAYEAGFSSPSYFAKCFKDEYGRTPGDFVSATAAAPDAHT